MRFGVLLLCNSTSDCLETAECHPGVVDCQSELKLFCGSMDFIFRAIQNQRQVRYNVSFGELLLCNSTSDCLETVECHLGVVGLSI